jgi:hypothetical protein
MHVDIRTITVGHVHAQPGDPQKVVAYHRWLLDHPRDDLPPLDVRLKPNGTYRIHDGRHRFVAYVLAERATVPVVLGRDWRDGARSAAARIGSRRMGVTWKAAGVVSCVVLAVCAALVAAGPGDAAQLRAVTGPLQLGIGIADQKANAFDDVRLQELGLPFARRSVAWDALRFPDQVADLDAWMAGVRLLGADPMITFARSRDRAGRRPRLPGPFEYLQQFNRFHKRYPDVKTFSAWNEANHCGSGTCNRPDIVARYYNTLRRNCPGCKIVAADLLDQPNMVSWTRRFRRAARFEPRYWGLHDYLDANRLQTVRTSALLRAVRGEVWLTEVGGIVARRNKSPIPIPQGKAHAATAMRFIFDRLARLDARVTRIYIYHWHSQTDHDSWDSALVGADGAERPSLAVLRRVVGETRR